MYEELPIEVLVENPRRTSRISRIYAKKLTQNIGETRHYEALTVRPSPSGNGRFEILNGHARLEALRSLDISTAKCDIWEITDRETGLFLAVLNKLRGTEVPELRLQLLLGLLKDYSKIDLATLIPETQSHLTRLEQIPAEAQRRRETKARPDVVLITFHMDHASHKTVNRALEQLMETHQLPDSSTALVRMAELYLASAPAGQPALREAI